MTQAPAAPVSLSTAELVAANLRYRSPSGPLLHRAYAHVICKHLLVADDPGGQTEAEIREGCRDLIVQGRPKKKHVEAALSLLSEKRVVGLQSGRRHDRWGLTDDARSDLEAQIEARRATVEASVRRHLPTAPGVERVCEWLDAVAARVFAAYGDRWVRNVTGRPAQTRRGWGVPRGDIGDVAREVAAEQGLAETADALADGLWGLLVSEDPDDRRLLWDYGRAMFAARLMAADLSADPISAAHLRGGVLMLDTNAMISFALGAAAGEPAYTALADALDAAGVDVRYLPQTLREYEGVCDRRRDETRRAIRGVPLFALQQSTDEWIVSGLRSESYKSGGWDAFFDELKDPSNEFADGVRAVEATDDDLLAAAHNGETDPEVVDQVQEAWQALSGNGGRRPKSAAVARHDAALINAAKHLRGSGRPVAVVSTDSSLLRLASDEAGPKGIPMWTSPEALLQIFAAETESGGSSATDFAPLLSRLIARDVNQAAGLAYELEDLSYLAEIDADVADLPVEDVQALARKLHRLHLQGKDREHPEVRREIRNDVSRRRRELGHDLETARATAAESDARNRTLEQQLDQAARDRERQKDQDEERRRLLIEERARPIRDGARLKVKALTAVGAIATLLLIGLAVYLFVAASRTPDGENITSQIGTATGLLGAVAVIVPLVWWPTKRLREQAAGAETTAERQLRDEGKLN